MSAPQEFYEVSFSFPAEGREIAITEEVVDACADAIGCTCTNDGGPDPACKADFSASARRYWLDANGREVDPVTGSTP